MSEAPRPAEEGLWGYESSVVAAELAGVRARYELLLGGRWQAPRAGRYDVVLRPSTEAPLTEVAAADAADAALALTAAVEAQRRWASLSGIERGKRLHHFAASLRWASDRLAAALSLDTGRPVHACAQQEVLPAVAHGRYFAGWADKLHWALRGRPSRPLGVVALLVDGGSPLAGVMERVAAALACGNAVVVKPARSAPLGGLLLGEIASEAGLPPGLLSVLTGGVELAEALVRQPEVELLHVSGGEGAVRALGAASVAAGKRIVVQRQLTATQLVAADASLEAAVDGTVARLLARVSGAGAGVRVLVQERAWERFAERLRERLGRLRVGEPLDRVTELGPLRAVEHLESARAERARTARVPSWTPPLALPPRGWYLAPSVLTEVSPSAPWWQAAEGAGPRITLTSFRTEPEALELLRRLPPSGELVVWSESGARALRLAQGAAAQRLWLNAEPTAAPGLGEERSMELAARGWELLRVFLEVGE